MPRSIDVEARKQQVIEAAWRVITRDGMAALSVRNVAREAGLAPSSLRYTFPSQASVREQSVRAVYISLRERIATIPRSSPTWARDMLLELLPLDAQRRIEMEVSLALGTAAVTDDGLRPLFTEVTEQVRQVCAEACAAHSATDPDQVRELHALIDGLSLHVIVEPEQDSTWARTVLDRYLQRLATKPQHPTG